MFCVTECISRPIKVTDCNNARWKPEIRYLLSIVECEPLLKVSTGSYFWLYSGKSSGHCMGRSRCISIWI